MLENYYPIGYPYYETGFGDDLYAAKWGMRMQFLDLNDPSLEPFPKQHFALIGFKSDKGVYINNGRVGAVTAPSTIRPHLANLPWHLGKEVQVYDVGNIDGPNCSLADLQESLTKAIIRMKELNLFPLVLGGGHETAYAHYKGLDSAWSKEKAVGVINFDAHFDLRPYDETGPNSGTGFRQIYDDCKAQGKDFPYFVLGIQEHNNNLFLFDFVAKSTSIQFLTGSDMYLMGYQRICQELDTFIAQQEAIHLTIDMDCFNAGSAPGVSAPQTLGLDVNLAVLLMQYIAASGKVVGVDIVETSPPHDVDDHTARLASTLFFYLTRILVQSH